MDRASRWRGWRVGRGNVRKRVGGEVVGRKGARSRGEGRDAMTVVRVRTWGGQMTDVEEWEGRAQCPSIRSISVGIRSTSVGIRSTSLVFLERQRRLSRDLASPRASPTVAS